MIQFNSFFKKSFCSETKQNLGFISNSPLNCYFLALQHYQKLINIVISIFLKAMRVYHGLFYKYKVSSSALIHIEMHDSQI